ncbi:MAG: transcriptional regulator [Deltaproteobacteria bacterium]|nr:MAG: transcriptional regulator [Deltaproteobacteria bacterium]
MPVYEYRCQSCGAEFELQRKFSEGPVEECPKCASGPVEKLISRSSFALKGSGWYQTDYGKKDSGASCAASGSKPACSGCPSAE